MSYEAEQQYLAAEAHFNVLALMNETATPVDRESFDSYFVEVRDHVYIHHSDPEYADMDNPRGHVYATNFFLRASNFHGYTRTFGSFESERQAWNSFLLGVVPPVREWCEGQPVYGSWAYQYLDCEAAQLAEERFQHQHGFEAA